ncbi:hypothetical protein [Actinomadura opuntiae]|uniref:hypothetical protein n=1 Tax=Actinomadura sp. OS1-43 TaxID=604315 RepID=UPI00255A9F96|nr:hypothetical protein [Actinomadura sp. OS1-43]MDL4812800.1 hypothetical protein [Actinomadura sp. OS1-43]
MTLTATVHVAGPPQFGGLRQQCAPCAHVLHDYTGTEIAFALQPGEPEPPTVGHWTEGAQVARVDGLSYLIQGRALDDDERECRPAS